MYYVLTILIEGVSSLIHVLITTDQSFTGLCINTCTWNYQQLEGERETEIGCFSHVQGDTDDHGLGYGLE